MESNHKGSVCIVDHGILCQEGWCSECDLGVGNEEQTIRKDKPKYTTSKPYDKEQSKRRKGL